MIFSIDNSMVEKANNMVQSHGDKKLKINMKEVSEKYEQYLKLKQRYISNFWKFFFILRKKANNMVAYPIYQEMYFWNIYL